MERDNELIYLVDPTTLQEVHRFDNKQALRRATGASASSIYNRIGKPLHKQSAYEVKEGAYQGKYLIALEQSLRPRKLTPADPNAEYVVTDGTRVYHKGSLADCNTMRNQLGFPTLKTQLWIKQ